MKKQTTIEMNKQDLINWFGGTTQAAKALLITYGAIAKWPDNVPPQSAWPAWIISGGEIKHQINVDISHSSKGLIAICKQSALWLGKKFHTNLKTKVKILKHTIVKV